jgi:hypothetical protein
MTQPDRFKQMVEKVESVVGVSSEGRDTCAVYSREVVTLLRRQHAAYVRLVHRIGDDVESGESATSVIDKLLAAMARHKKGRP